MSAPTAMSISGRNARTNIRRRLWLLLPQLGTATAASALTLAPANTAATSRRRARLLRCHISPLEWRHLCQVRRPRSHGHPSARHPKRHARLRHQQGHPSRWRPSKSPAALLAGSSVPAPKSQLRRPATSGRSASVITSSHASRGRDVSYRDFVTSGPGVRSHVPAGPDISYPAMGSPALRGARFRAASLYCAIRLRSSTMQVAQAVCLPRRSGAVSSAAPAGNLLLGWTMSPHHRRSDLQRLWGSAPATPSASSTTEGN
jgi:hypothetical protein